MNKYEISVWEDVISDDGKYFEERKLIIIGSDTMTSENRAREPKLVSNVNGTNKFTFNMYYSYIDTQTGEKVQNPYVKYLVNERKIKVFWKDEWYDLLIKQIKEDSVNHVFTYTCEDAYITELSRTGFELTFDTELQNNIGTAPELIEKVIENTDWVYDAAESDKIYQETEEPVYEAVVLDDGILAARDPDGQRIDLQKNLPILVFYSCAPDKDNLKDQVQFYYSGTSYWEQDENDMLVINGTSYTINVRWQVDDEKATALDTAFRQIFTINLASGVSQNYRAKRYVQSYKSVYNNIVERYVNVYTHPRHGEVYGYSGTEFNDALTVVNLITNSSNFSNTSGWIKSNQNSNMYFKISPSFGKNTVIAEYTAKSYLYLELIGRSTSYFNTGIQNSRSYISDGFIQGQRYICRIKAKKASGTEPADQGYIETPDSLTPSIQSRNNNYQPGGYQYFSIKNSTYDRTTNWLEYEMECDISCPYEKLLSVLEPFGFFLTVSVNCWIEEIQFFREVYGVNGSGESVRINPGQMNTQSVAQVVWKYFKANQPEGTTKDNLEYLHTSLGEWNEVTPISNNYEKYGTIEESNSNRFNILQTIAETFECWIRFEIEHDKETGYIVTDDDGGLHKFIRLKRETGRNAGFGFEYGIDLKGVVRNIKSDKISTKTIVEQNENEFGKNGFCSIARSELNYSRESFIYNFDYYIQQGLLDREILYNDLYNSSSSSPYLGYYSRLHQLNVDYAKNSEILLEKRLELTKQNATLVVYNQYVVSSREELTDIEDSLVKLAGVSDFSQVTQYAQQHRTDTKVQSLINDRAQVKQSLNTYENLLSSLKNSIEILKTSIKSIDNGQKEIIEKLRKLNKRFYVKYSRFIQEGTWTSENYWDDDLYYLDALQVAYTSSRPQITYEINVLRLSDLEDFSSKVFKLGDVSFVQDVEYFGYQKDGITPYKEQVILSEITSCFDTPEKDSIKVQNYKTQFDDLFQRITAAVQNLELNEGKYAKAANMVTSDGLIKSSVIQNTFNENKDLVYGAQNESATIDNTGITVIDNGNAAKQVKVTSGGVFVTNDGGVTWKNAIRGDGISTDLLTAGRINTEEITVYNGDYPSFRWDPNGLNAYKFDSNGVDTTQFIRFDQYGIYGMKDTSQVYIPQSEAQIYNDANFGLTWNKFFMKNKTGDKSIEISTDRDIVVTSNGYERVVIGRVDGSSKESYGIRIRDGENKIIFESGNLWDEVLKKYVEKANIAGWAITDEYLESSASSELENTIKIYANGNIGCYAKNAENLPAEPVYGMTNSPIKTTNAFVVTNLTNNNNINIAKNTTIYPFVSSIGPTKTQRRTSGKYNDGYTNPSSDYIPKPPAVIQIVANDINYKVEVDWIVTRKNTSHVQEEFTIKDKDGNDKKYYFTTYTYTFDLEARKNNVKIFSIPYQETFTITKSKYRPASKTKWYIDNQGDAVFHEIYADGGTIAGWFIDNEKIYQTTNGKRDGPIKTQLNSSGTASSGGFDYSIVTDAINAAMANIGGVLMSAGLINGYNIAQVAARAEEALNTAYAAYNLADNASTVANNANARANSAHALVAGIRAAFYDHGHTTENSDGTYGWTTSLV